MDTEERLTRARIKLQSQNPFFSYLSLYLKFKESKDLEEWAGMGVDSSGNLYYKKEFVDGLSDEELKGVLCHEILHLSLLHLLRAGKRNSVAFNIACDIVVNIVLDKNYFQLPNGCLIPQNNHNLGYSVFQIGNVTIKNCDEKTAEEIYDELPKKFKDENGNYKLKNGNGFDKHIQSEGLSKEDEEKEREKWKKRISEAYISAKQRGELPNGLEKLIGKLHKEQIDWKELLRKYLTSMLPMDYNYMKRHKKSISCGYYMPNVVKEKVKVAVAIDTSGSIGKKELTDFISEIVGLARAYKNQMDMILYTHDYEIQDTYEIENGNIDKIMKLELNGGGGTSHKGLITTINQDIKDCKAVIFFTDGYSDLESIDFTKNKFQSIFVISSNGSDKQLKDKNVVVINIK